MFRCINISDNKLFYITTEVSRVWFYWQLITDEYSLSCDLTLKPRLFIWDDWKIGPSNLWYVHVQERVHLWSNRDNQWGRRSLHIVFCHSPIATLKDGFHEQFLHTPALCDCHLNNFQVAGMSTWRHLLYCRCAAVQFRRNLVHVLTAKDEA